MIFGSLVLYFSWVDCGAAWVPPMPFCTCMSQLDFWVPHLWMLWYIALWGWIASGFPQRGGLIKWQFQISVAKQWSALSSQIPHICWVLIPKAANWITSLQSTVVERNVLCFFFLSFKFLSFPLRWLPHVWHTSLWYLAVYFLLDCISFLNLTKLIHPSALPCCWWEPLG